MDSKGKATQPCAMQTWSWTKTVFVGNKENKEQYLTYVNCTIHNKFECIVELKTNKERRKCKSMLANIQMPHKDPRVRKKMNPSTLPYSSC